MASTIYLVGARASGKTTVGRALAHELAFAFVDTDRYLCETLRLSVAELVAREGWDGFRRRETEALQAVTAPGRVIATGGGMVLSAFNREYMRRNGTVFYLQVPVAIMARRLQSEPNAAQRPSLTGRSITEEIQEVLASREELYRAAAHHALDGARSVSCVVKQALDLLKVQAG
jgi:shikimate kinase